MEEIFYLYNPWWLGESKFPKFKRQKLIESLLPKLESRQILIITGLRRVGKTSLMKLLIEHLLQKGINPVKILYLSLDNIVFKDKTIWELVEFYRKIHGLRHSEFVYLFLDEVVYKPNFQQELKNLYDLDCCKIVISASSATVLRDKKAFLTGRNTIYELLPMDFDEFLQFRGLNLPKYETQLYEKYFEEYLLTGGLPEQVLQTTEDFISQLISDILLKDIAAIHNIRNTARLNDFFLLLIERSGKKISLNKIAKILKISPDTAVRLYNYFLETYLFSQMPKCGKLNVKMTYAKKIYVIDTGIRAYFTGKRDYGSLFENYVYTRIKQFEPCYIEENGIELDFLVKNILIEAKYHTEPLDEKQKQLFESFKPSEKFVVRNYWDLQNVLQLLSSQQTI